jgi:uncharacterized protein
VVHRRRLAVLIVAAAACVAAAQPPTPQLTGPVNDLAGLIDPASKSELERRIRLLMDATGDVIIVATVPTYEGFADIRELAVKMFENRGGRGVGAKGSDNGLLIVVSRRERRVAIEVGYGLEGIVTDGLAGEIIRESMIPAFRSGAYGDGLVAAVARLSERISEARGVKIEGLPREPVRDTGRRRLPGNLPFILLLVFVFLVIWISQMAENRRRRRWRRGPWSGWQGGVGPFGGGPFGGGFGGFGGGFGGGSGGGGFGGFGGFGGGRSGGGGAAGGW